ncbi:MAG: NUDIX domain-containing protein [Oscillospiraceae bacterium]|jgi:adenylate kinase family enzyme|nr:NUDIX domain-containing protein [Oscillospiraceae bacterium]
MALPRGLIVFGASGSGTSTLGRALAERMGAPVFDLDDYYWEPTDPPFQRARPIPERQRLLLESIKDAPRFVLSGHMPKWDAPFLPMLELGVFVITPTALRLERLQKREAALFGARIEAGGDMAEEHRAFLDWAAQYDTAGLELRSRRLHEDWIERLPCPVCRVNGAENTGALVDGILAKFYTPKGAPWRVITAPLGTLQKYRFTVVFARIAATGQWLYARHRARDTWETAGGHIEAGETPEACARRELYEETGAIDFTIRPLFDYAVHREKEFSYGQVFLAEIAALGAIPEGSEMAEVAVVDGVPERMTYPGILTVLFGAMVSEREMGF